MPKTSETRAALSEGSRAERSLGERNAAGAASRLVTSPELMGTGDQLALPRLDGVAIEHRVIAGDEPVVALAKNLLELDIAVPEDWEKAKRDPGGYVGMTLARWIAKHGGEAIKRRFDLTAAVTTWLDSYAEKEPEDPNQLYLTVDAGSAGYVVFGAALELLEKSHPRLPATFFHLFSGALNKWIRLYDYQDALEHVAMLREWIEGEPDENQYEVPDVEGCIPACMKLRPLTRNGLRGLVSRARDRTMKSLIVGAIELAEIGRRAKRPTLTDAMREEMGDMNPPLPGLLTVFKSDDAIEGCFDEEAQGMMECTPEPSLIIPLIAGQPPTVKTAFHTLGTVCDTLAAASRLIDRMPGNDRGVIQGGASDGASENRG